MKTTAVRIEILTIGIQVGVIAIYLFHLEVSEYWQQGGVESLERFSALVVLVALALCYSLGSIVDGITAIIDGAIPFF
ncbi:MAG: hypothetical protein AAFO93_12610 [Pseudomonadota bacterium]